MVSALDLLCRTEAAALKPPQLLENHKLKGKAQVHGKLFLVSIDEEKIKREKTCREKMNNSFFYGL